MGKELGTVIHKCLACHYGYNNWELGFTDIAPHTGLSEFSVYKLLQFIACPQAWAYRWKLGLELPEPNLQQYYNEARPVVEMYLDAYRRIDGELEPIAVEHQIVVDFGGVNISCRIDLIARHENRIVLLDHKTAANIQSRVRGTHIEIPLIIQELCFLKSEMCQQKNLLYGGLYLNLINPNMSQKVGINERLKRTRIDFDKAFVSPLTTTLLYAKYLQDELIDRDAWSFPRLGHLNGICLNGKYGACIYRPLCQHGKSEMGRYLWQDQY